MSLEFNKDPEGLFYSPSLESGDYPKGNDPCGCFMKSFFGVSELSILAVSAATAPLATKPRKGVDGGGNSKDKTSILSKYVVSPLQDKMKDKSIPPSERGRNILTRKLRDAGRLAGRLIPYVGLGLFGNDFRLYEQCLSNCDECKK